MALTIVVLAAGQGKRMNSDVPKVLQPLAGGTVLAHVLDTARALEPAAVNVVYGHGGDAVRDAYGDADLDWTLQSEQLGTGHALAQALPSIPESHQVLVLYADVPLIRVETLTALVAQTPSAGVGVLTARVEDPSGYGRIKRTLDGEVSGIVEEKDASDDERAIREINTGLMVMPAKSIKRWVEALENDNVQGEFYLTDVIAMAVSEGLPVVGLVAADSADTLGINDKTQLAAAERVIQKRHAAEIMAQGATLADPARFDIRGTLMVGRDVFIDIGALFIGDVVLGDRVQIGANTVISNSELGDDCHVHPNCVLDGVTAGPSCEIGPFARLRPGTQFAERVKVGNFVEVKASEVARGSKMNHLSYVGDSRVGSDVNIGAGTITCNYDGANKHITRIGDRVFVGSGAMLVAPVELAEGSTIAAGSTITKDVSKQELAVARSRQTMIKGWKRPKKPGK